MKTVLARILTIAPTILACITSILTGVMPLRPGLPQGLARLVGLLLLLVRFLSHVSKSPLPVATILGSDLE